MQVRLDQSGGDGQAVLALTGAKGELLDQLARLASAREHEQALRLRGAHAIVTDAPHGALRVFVDLRDPQHGAARVRRGPAMITHTWKLPWLVVEGPGYRAEVLRWTHVRARKRFRGGGVQAKTTRAELDVLAVRRGERWARLPLRGPTRVLRVELKDALEAPPPRPLPSTIPLGRGSRAPLAVGLATSLLLLVGLPWAVHSLIPAPPATTAEADAGTLAVVHSLIHARDVEARRAGACLASRLPSEQRGRLLRRSFEREPNALARALILDLMVEAGEEERSRVAQVYRNGQRTLEERLHALRSLARRRDPRALDLALLSLERGLAPEELRRLCLAVVADPPPAFRERAVRVLSLVASEDSSLSIRAAAACELCALLDAPPDLGPLLDLVLNAPERRLAPRLTRAWLAQSPSIAAIESRLQRPELDAGVAALLRQTLANRK
ncbi:MAG: hypothetical protein KDD82_18230 [Planctomycetes bacterium]|nr:hypothetical protein [Planctomycetota bacterium]